MEKNILARTMKIVDALPVTGRSHAQSGRHAADPPCRTGAGWYRTMKDEELPEHIVEARKNRKKLAKEAVRRTRSGKNIDGNSSDWSSRTASSQDIVPSKRSRAAHPTAGKFASRKRQKRRSSADSDKEESESEYETRRRRGGNAKQARRRRANSSTSSLSELSGDSDLTDLDELESVPGIAVNSKTGTLTNPHTMETTTLSATAANAKLLSATIPVAVDEDMPSPMTFDSPFTLDPASPDAQEPAKSLSKGLLDTVGGVIRKVMSVPIPLSPRTETSESHSQ